MLSRHSGKRAVVSVSQLQIGGRGTGITRVHGRVLVPGQLVLRMWQGSAHPDALLGLGHVEREDKLRGGEHQLDPRLDQTMSEVQEASGEK